MERLRRCDVVIGMATLRDAMARRKSKSSALEGSNGFGERPRDLGDAVAEPRPLQSR
jgi:hypothetical protein